MTVYHLDLKNPDKPTAIDKLTASVWREIQYARKRGRAPLFIVGAGVSCASPANVPLMADLLSHIVGLTSKLDPADEITKLCVQASKTRNRSDAAILFGALQNRQSDCARKVWEIFCEDFLLCRITRAGNGEIMRHRPEPTPAHRYIARMCVDHGAHCLSVNFDGLTRRAIDECVGTDGKCGILDTAEKVENFFARDRLRENSKPLYAVYKIRGDIFYARCQTSGCPLEKFETPVYDLDSYNKTPGPGGPAIEWVLACPECGERRTLQIGFPGHHEKEVESEKILASLWRIVVPSTSMLILLGFSGEWDHATVDFLFTAALSQNIRVIDVRLEPEENAHYIRDVWRTKYNEVKYKYGYSTADTFAEHMDKNMGEIESDPEPKILSNGKNLLSINGFPKEIPADRIWSEKTKSSNGSAWICNDDEFKKLEYFSQLGLKTFWWGAIESLEDHNRYLHSIGTMRVAEQWHEKFFKFNRHNVKVDVEREKEFLRISALLHDFGHLPFSHLFEEIFDELHWIPFSYTERPWHEVLTRQKFSELIKKPLAGDLYVENYITKRLGYEPEDVLNLIDGCTGKAYISAIVNSPLDADKIDYIFRDLAFLKSFGSPHAELPDSPPASSARDWLQEFLEYQELSPEGLIRLNKRSALLALDLLETRRDLYLKFYLAPELRAMERVTAFVLVCYLGLVLPEKLYEAIKKNETEQPLPFDHGNKKVEIASKEIIAKYASVISYSNENNQPILREGLLLDNLLAELCGQKQRIDGAAHEVLIALQELITRFPKKKDGNGITLGKDVRTVYEDLHVAGPYYAASRHESKLREIVRELTLLYQGAVLFDVVKTPRLLASPTSRKFGAVGGGNACLYGETFLVPHGRPSQWSVKSCAKVPLHTVDFGHLNHRYLQILLLDPLGQPAKSNYIGQQFLRGALRRI